MRAIALAAVLSLAAAPVFAQTHPSADSSYQRHAASRHFARAGDSVGHTAHETGKALGHGWKATKQAVGSEWNRATGHD